MKDLDIQFQEIWKNRMGRQPLVEQLTDLAIENKLHPSDVIRLWNQWRDAGYYNPKGN